MKLLDVMKLEIDDVQKWIDELFYQTKKESKIKKERCKICNSREELCNLELHHVSGRKHDYGTITVCLACHRYLSDKQKIWDKRWLEKNQTEYVRQAFFLLGLQNILELKTVKTGNSIYEKLAYSYNEKINVLLGRWQN